MNILYLTPRLPYPPDRGDKIRTYHHLRHLAQAHRVSLVSLLQPTDDVRQLRQLAELCDTVEVVPTSAFANLRGAASMARGATFSAGHFGGRRVRAAIRQLVQRCHFEVVWASVSSLAPLLRGVDADMRVVDSVDVDSAKWRQFARHSSPPLRWVYALEARQVRRLECEVAHAADRVLFVSQPEADTFRRIVGGTPGICVVPNGVDTQFFRPSLMRAPGDPPQVLFSGTLDYLPNVQAAMFLANEVLPLLRRRLPAIRLTLAGHRPTRRLRAVARVAGDVTVTGSIADMRPLYGRAQAYAAPIFFGRGVKTKVLEAMAMGVPVVATPCALDGLDLERGRQVLEARSAAEFAEAILMVLRDPGRAQHMTQAALEWVRTAHDWRRCLEPLDAMLRRG